MKMGTVGASNMLMNFYKILHCHIPKVSAVCSDCHKNLECHKVGHVNFLAFTVGVAQMIVFSLLIPCSTNVLDILAAAVFSVT
jgi:hypothetical protein